MKYIVFHNNGKGAQYGYTEYSQLELDELYDGSIEKLIACYEEKNILVYKIEILVYKTEKVEEK